MVKINIEVIVDTACPFCYVAQKRIAGATDKYKSRYPGDSVVVQWLPFQLLPNAGKTSMKLTALLASRYGLAAVEQKIKIEEEIGRAEGIKFNSDRMIGNTFDSHRMIHLAGLISSTVQSSLVQVLFKGHFEDGQDLSSHAFLVQSAVDAGMDRGDVEKWLHSSNGAREVDEKIRKAMATGLRGVPYIVVGGLYPISGHYTVDKLLGFFETIRSDELARSGP